VSWNEGEIAAARRAIHDTAQAMLAGELSCLEGARVILNHSSPAKLAWDDPDLLPLTGVVSETDALPLGEERMHWQAAALEALQAEIDSKEIWARRICEPPCKSLVIRLRPLSEAKEIAREVLREYRDTFAELSKR